MAWNSCGIFRIVHAQAGTQVFQVWRPLLIYRLHGNCSLASYPSYENASFSTCWSCDASCLTANASTCEQPCRPAVFWQGTTQPSRTRGTRLNKHSRLLQCGRSVPRLVLLSRRNVHLSLLQPSRHGTYKGEVHPGPEHESVS